MIDSRNPLLLVAHPGHELLLYGWMLQARPRVCVLTDGSGHHASSRLNATDELLAEAGASRGEIFGKFTDREIYAALLAGGTEIVTSLADELAHVIAAHSIDAIVTDAMEGFNPIHDLCRILAGAAADAERIPVRRYEYPLHAGPMPRTQTTVVHELDDSTLMNKLAAARRMSVTIPDIAEMLETWGPEAFRFETFNEVRDWAAPGWPEGERPLYEQIGEQRVTDGRYQSVIRYREHFQPLTAALALSSKCAF